MTEMRTPILIAESAEPERARYRARSRSASLAAIGAVTATRSVNDKKNGASKISPGISSTSPSSSSGAPPLPSPPPVPPE